MSYWPIPLLILAADFSFDGVVDAADLSIMLEQWNGSGQADLTGDGQVDAADLDLLVFVWGGRYGRNDVGDGLMSIVPAMHDPQWGPSPFPGHRRLTYIDEQGDLVAIDELIE